MPSPGKYPGDIVNNLIVDIPNYLWDTRLRPLLGVDFYALS